MNLAGRPNPTPVRGDSRTCAQTAAYALRRQLTVASVLGLAVIRWASPGNRFGVALGMSRIARTRNGANSGRNTTPRAPMRRKTRRDSGPRTLTRAKQRGWNALIIAD